MVVIRQVRDGNNDEEKTIEEIIKEMEDPNTEAKKQSWEEKFEDKTTDCQLPQDRHQTLNHVRQLVRQTQDCPTSRIPSPLETRPAIHR